MSVIGFGSKPPFGSSPRKRTSRVAEMIGRWSASNDGSALIEFSVMLPVLVAVMVGTVEMASMIAAKSRAADIAMTIGDLVTKNEAMDKVRIGQLFKAADATLQSGALQSADGTEAEVWVTSALACACKDNPSTFCFTTLWSHKYVDGEVKDGYLAEDKLPEIPTGVAHSADETVIMTEVVYKYVAPVQFLLDSDVYTFEERVYHRPRFSDRISHTGTQSEASQRHCEEDGES